MKNTEYLDGFYGSEFQPQILDAFLARNINPRDWQVIPELYNHKWFGYRFLTPGQCLYLFADRFRQEYSSVRGRPKLKNFKQFGYQRQNMITQLNKLVVAQMFNAMCYCDTVGIPYDFYCKTVFERTERLGWSHLPGPNQIYHTSFLWHVKEAWEERLTSGLLVRTKDPYYFLNNYHGHAWQDEYMKWLIDQAMSRPNPKYALAKIMFEEPQVKPSFAAQHISLEHIKEARRVANIPTG
ncbi:MAG: hypothetical protein NXH70_02505 [Hyphomonas sp.]|nr:hypothetical protein [Hyphomonas sp.]